jgi:hypothetical protein
MAVDNETRQLAGAPGNEHSRARQNAVLKRKRQNVREGAIERDRQRNVAKRETGHHQFSRF